jgi:hypothetical protein
LWIDVPIVGAVIPIENIRSVQRRRFRGHCEVRQMYRKTGERERDGAQERTRRE